MSKRRQKRAQLRALECLAYSSTISYLRSQIDDDKEAKYILEHLRTLLHISSPRHLAELKRILNDEELERLSAIKHIGQNDLKHQWIELEEEEENKLNKKKFKTT